MMRKLFVPLVFVLASCAVQDGDVSPDILNRWTQFKTSNGLVANRVLCVFEDSKGNIWIGTNGGVSVYNGTSFKNYTTANGLVSNIINAFVEDKDGAIWVATDNGVNYFKNGNWLPIEFFSGARISSLLELSNKDILISTGGYGATGYGTILYKFSEDAFYYFYYDDLCGDCNVGYTMIKDSKGSVWIGTQDGVKKITGNSLTSYTTTQGLSGNVVTAIQEDRWGNVWIGTLDGRTISRIRNGKVEEVNLANSSPQNWVRDFAVDSKGNLWISVAYYDGNYVYGLGLHRYDGAVMRKDFENLPDENVTSLFKDSHGNIWIGTWYDGLLLHTPN